jgi:hypothetical protein
MTAAIPAVLAIELAAVHDLLVLSRYHDLVMARRAAMEQS